MDESMRRLIEEKVEKIVMTSGLPPTFERLRQALQVTKVALEPVIEQLTAENKIRAVEVGDVTLYEPPRIEPIRRRRREHPAVAVASSA